MVELQKNKKANITVHLVDNPNKKIENKHTFLKVNYKSALTFDFSPMKIKRESQKKLYGNYVKAGIGNFQNSYAEAFFNTRRSEKQSYGVYLKHTNLREGAIDARNSADAQNKLVFSFQSFSKKGVFTGKVGLQQQQWHFYGYQRTDPIPAAKDIQQDFITFEGQIGYTNKLEASKNYHDIGLFYHYWADRYAAKEQEIGGEFSKKINFNVNNKLFFKANVSSSMRSDEVGSIQRNLLNTELYHQINYSKLYLQIGLRAALHNDTLKEMEKAFLYPKLYLSFSLFKNKLDVFLQLDGGMQKRLMRDMVSENPYLVANTPLLHTNKTWESSLGFRTKLANGINWQASASYGFYQYLYFFMNSSTFPSKFFVQYETAITPVSTFISEFSASFGKFRAKLCTELQKYELKTLQSAWHRPLVKNTLSVGYSIEKFAINVDIYHLEGIKAFDVISSQQKDLQPITDVNMKIDYQFSPMWSVFAKGSNLLSQQYQRFLYYDARTAQVMAGASLTF
ncbi:MAG: hypothetical protein EAZ08_03605 [Cytophagales bacterium]|nr:MAG: hypothetical protein EAZ08_03605 [Cytophagales bacterium]